MAPLRQQEGQACASEAHPPFFAALQPANVAAQQHNYQLEIQK
jgi:hypothetical protein